MLTEKVQNRIDTPSQAETGLKSVSRLTGCGDGEDECSLLEFVPSDFDTFEEVIKRNESQAVSEKVQQYISRLSDRQVNILNLLVDGYKPTEILLELQISAREYAENMQIIRSYENVKILF